MARVRQAKFADILRIRELMQELYQRSKYAGYTLNDRAFKNVCIEALRTHGGPTCLFVAEDDNGVHGFIIGITDGIYGFGKERYATDVIFYVSPESGGASSALKLGRAFIEWAESSPGVVEIQMGATDAAQDYEQTAKLLERLGLKQSGVIYSKGIGK